MQLQMMDVLNSQGDGIVVVEKVPQGPEQSHSKSDVDVEDKKDGEAECKVQFLNSKSVELFGFDIMRTTSSEELKQ